MNKIAGIIQVMNCRINADFDAEIQKDGSIKIWFNDAIIIPPDKFKVGIIKDMR